jgi:RNA polymerase sigma-70 factor (ECF subfamily)
MKGEPSNEHGQGPNPEMWLEDHGDYLFRYALVRLRDREIAEDMVQETFLAALRAREKFQARSSVRTWLIGILKHKILDHFRKSYREPPISDLLSSEDPSETLFDEEGKWKLRPIPWTDDPRAVLEQKEFWETLLRCMSELPRRLAEVFALRELEGLKGEEICNLTKISATNLGVMLHRARMRLRRCLEINWFVQKPEKE